MKTLNEIKKFLGSTKAFDVKTTSYTADDNVTVRAYENYIIVHPLTAESERQLLSNPYIRLLKSKKHCFALFYFPAAVQKRVDRENNAHNFAIKYQTRLKHLLDSKKNGNVDLQARITLPPKEFLKLKYIAKPFKKSDSDFQEDNTDTICSNIAKPQKPFLELKRVSLTYNTLLILKNKSLSYYQNAGMTTFYTDCIINYILELSNRLSPESFSFPKTPNEVRIPVRELRKLYPHRTFKLNAPDGVTIQYETRENAERLSKNDTAIFQFSSDYLEKFRKIIMEEDSNADDTESFIKIPMFFILQALKRDNLTAKGSHFLLWFLSFYRMRSPKIFHSLKTILEETSADTKHGYKKPLTTLNKYFDYLFSVNAFYNINEPVKFKVKDLNKPPQFNGALLQLQKPKLKPPKN